MPHTSNAVCRLYKMQYWQSSKKSVYIRLNLFTRSRTHCKGHVNEICKIIYTNSGYAYYHGIL